MFQIVQMGHEIIIPSNDTDIFTAMKYNLKGGRSFINTECSYTIICILGVT